jgi:serine/threonine protein kinase
MRTHHGSDPWLLRDLSDAFTVENQIGEGVYGKVHKARDVRTDDAIALKKVKTDLTVEKEGFPITALREIQILKELAHQNIVALHEVALGDSDKSVYLTFEYLEHDLSGLMESRSAGLTEDHIRCYMKQLICGVAHMHSRNVLHRDIKASNLLISSNGLLKIGDWGLARRQADEDGTQHYTNRVITLWYRPPELLLGATKAGDGYGPSVDVWSIGCILAELLYAKPILPGNTEIEQLSLIFELCGTPTVEDWPEVYGCESISLFQIMCES